MSSGPDRPTGEFRSALLPGGLAQPVTLILPFPAPGRPVSAEPVSAFEEPLANPPPAPDPPHLGPSTSLSLGGCATFRTLSTLDPERPKIYSGTRLDLNVTVGDESWPRKFGLEPPRYPVIDLPFSFILDTVMLPSTIPNAIFK